MAHAEASAKTVDAAVIAAAAQLGLRSDQVDVEVLEEPVPSTFGYIGTPARVRVTPRAQEGSTEPNISSQAGAPRGPGLTSESPIDAGAAATETGNGQVPADRASQVEGQPTRQAGDRPASQTEERPAGAQSATAPANPAAPAEPDTAPLADSGASAAASSATALPPSPAGAPRSEIASGIDRLEARGDDPQSSSAPSSASSSAVTDDPATAAAVSEPGAARPPRRAYKDEPIDPQAVEEDTERAGDFLEGLLDAMDVDGDITTWVDEVGGHIDLEGVDLDSLVGPNGETLDSLQELTRLAVLRQSKRRVRLLIDINGFRARQRDQLVSIVQATVEQVIRTREDHEFQPMSPAERKIVHDAVAAMDGARTESLGEEPNRRVVIRPT